MAIPTWLQSIPPGTWGSIPSSTLSTSGVMQDTSGSGSHYIVDDWGGGILNTHGLYIGSTFVSGTFKVIWGGGHGNYGGNEVYAFGPYEDNAPAWYRLRDATSPFPQNVEYDAGGNPVARHTYSCLSYVYDGTRNWMVAMGCLFRYTDANTLSTLFVYDFNVASPNSNNPWSTKTAGTYPGDGVVFDAARGRLWYHAFNVHYLGYYNIAGDSHTLSGNHRSSYFDGANYHGMAAFDPTRGIIGGWDYNTGISFYDTAGGVAGDYYIPTTLGPGPAVGDGSILYDSVNDYFVVWRNDSKAFWTLRAPFANYLQGGSAWTWNKITPNGGGVPSSQNASGTYGRFQFVNSGDVVGYTLMNSPTGAINFFNAAKPGPQANFRRFPSPLLARK